MQTAEKAFSSPESVRTTQPGSRRTDRPSTTISSSGNVSSRVSSTSSESGADSGSTTTVEYVSSSAAACASGTAGHGSRMTGTSPSRAATTSRSDGIAATSAIVRSRDHETPPARENTAGDDVTASTALKPTP